MECCASPSPTWTICCSCPRPTSCDASARRPPPPWRRCAAPSPSRWTADLPRVESECSMLGADSTRRGCSAPSQLVEAGVVDAHVVSQLVHHGDPHLLDQLGLVTGQLAQ